MLIPSLPLTIGQKVKYRAKAVLLDLVLSGLGQRLKGSLATRLCRSYDIYLQWTKYEQMVGGDSACCFRNDYAISFLECLARRVLERWRHAC
jgi:hypothetical protein